MVADLALGTNPAALIVTSAPAAGKLADMTAHHCRWLLPLMAAVALAAFLVGRFVWPAEPLQGQLDLVLIGMTQDDVENILGAPSVFTPWGALDVLTYQGRDGVAEVLNHKRRRSRVNTYPASFEF